MKPETYRSWILLSLGAQPTDLARICATADWINHAIPTSDELADSLGFLCAAGLAESAGDTYRLSQRGLALIRAHEHGEPSIDVLWQRLEVTLASTLVNA